MYIQYAKVALFALFYKSRSTIARSKGEIKGGRKRGKGILPRDVPHPVASGNRRLRQRLRQPSIPESVPEKRRCAYRRGARRWRAVADRDGRPAVANRTGRRREGRRTVLFTVFYEKAPAFSLRKRWNRILSHCLSASYHAYSANSQNRRTICETSQKERISWSEAIFCGYIYNIGMDTNCCMDSQPAYPRPKSRARSCHRSGIRTFRSGLKSAPVARTKFISKKTIFLFF